MQVPNNYKKIISRTDTRNWKVSHNQDDNTDLVCRFISPLGIYDVVIEEADDKSGIIVKSYKYTTNEYGDRIGETITGCKECKDFIKAMKVVRKEIKLLNN